MKKIILAIVCIAFASQISIAQILDNSFGLQGRVRGNMPGEAEAIAMQADGKIITAGYGMQSSSNHFQLMRFNTDGKQDSTFGINGTVNTEVAFSSNIVAIAIQPDGKIIAGGNYQTGDFVNIGHMVIARYHANGVIDSSFGTNGMVMPEPGYVDRLSDLKLQADGKIVIGGAIASIVNLEPTSFLVGRFNSNGSLDVNFGTGGFTATPISFTAEIRSIALLPDGNIIAAGQAGLGDTPDPDYRSFAIVKYNGVGDPNVSFGNNGIVVTDVVAQAADFLHSMVVQSDGKILTAGSTGVNHYLVRYQPNGNLDSTFGTNGKAFRTSLPAVLKLALYGNNKIITGCDRTGSSAPPDFMMNGYLANGAANTSFGTSGTVQTDFPTAIPEGSDDYSKCILIAPDGKVLLAGNAGGIVALTRYSMGAPTGIQNASVKNINVRMYPNPVKDRITIQCENQDVASDANISITNIAGQNVFTKRLMLKNGETMITIPNLASGNYILSITTEKGMYFAGKITKQ